MRIGTAWSSFAVLTFFASPLAGQQLDFSSCPTGISAGTVQAMPADMRQMARAYDIRSDVHTISDLQSAIPANHAQVQEARRALAQYESLPSDPDVDQAVEVGKASVRFNSEVGSILGCLAQSNGLPGGGSRPSQSATQEALLAILDQLSEAPCGSDMECVRELEAAAYQEALSDASTAAATQFQIDGEEPEPYLQTDTSEVWVADEMGGEEEECYEWEEPCGAVSEWSIPSLPEGFCDEWVEKFQAAYVEQKRLTQRWTLQIEWKNDLHELKRELLATYEEDYYDARADVLVRAAAKLVAGGLQGWAAAGGGVTAGVATQQCTTRLVAPVGRPADLVSAREGLERFRRLVMNDDISGYVRSAGECIMTGIAPAANAVIPGLTSLAEMAEFSEGMKNYRSEVLLQISRLERQLELAVDQIRETEEFLTHLNQNMQLMQRHCH